MVRTENWLIFKVLFIFNEFITVSLAGNYRPNCPLDRDAVVFLYFLSADSKPTSEIAVEFLVASMSALNRAVWSGLRIKHCK